MHAAFVADEIWGFMLEPAIIYTGILYEYVLQSFFFFLFSFLLRQAQTGCTSDKRGHFSSTTNEARFPTVQHQQDSTLFASTLFAKGVISLAKSLATTCSMPHKSDRINQGSSRDHDPTPGPAQ